MAKRAGSDFDLFGDVKINTKAAIDGLKAVDGLLSSLSKKLGNIEKRFSKSSLVMNINKGFNKAALMAERIKTQEFRTQQELNKAKIQQLNLEEKIIKKRNYSNKIAGITGPKILYTDSKGVTSAYKNFKNFASPEAINNIREKHSKFLQDTRGFTPDEANRIANLKNYRSMAAIMNQEAAIANGYARKRVAEEKRITREKEKQLKLLERQKLAQQGILDKIFNIKNMLLAITASYMSRMVMQAVGIANRFQSVDVRFKALTNNASIAASEVDWIYERATTLRQPILDAAEGYSKFYAAARSTMASDQIKEIYDALLQTSTVMHIQPHQFKLVSLAVEQMASKGTVTMEELRRQLGEHIPGAFGVAARAMGKTEKEFNDMVKRGEVFASEFLPKFAAQLKKEFGSGLQAALQSSQAKIIALQNSITMLQKKFADSGFIEAIGNVADSLRMALESKQFMEAFVAMGNAAKAFSKLIPMLLPLIELLVVMFGARYIGKFITFIRMGLPAIMKTLTFAKATAFLWQTLLFDILMRLLPKIINFFATFKIEWDWILYYMKQGWAGLFKYIRDNFNEIGNDMLDIIPFGVGKFFQRPNPSQSTSNITNNRNNYNNDVKVYVTAKDSKDIEIAFDKALSGAYVTGGN